MTQVIKGYKDNYTGSNGNSWSRGRSFDSGINNYKIPRKRVRFNRWAFRYYMTPLVGVGGI